MIGNAIARNVDCRLDQVTQIAPVEFGKHGPGFDTGHIQQVIDDPVETIERLLALGQSSLAARAAADLAAQRVQSRPHRGQWRFKLVGNTLQQRPLQALGIR